MTTNAQIKANRNNAKKSTGPRTEQGKARVAKNALKHGLLARDTVLPGEDAADFDRQLSALEADPRRDERKSREARSSAGSYAPADPYRGRYVPAQAPPPIDTPSPTAGRIGFRASSKSGPQPGFTQTTKQTQFPPTPMKSAPFKDEPCSADLPFEIRGLSAPPLTDSTSPSGDASPHRAGNQHSRYVKESDSFVAHTLSVPRRDSSRRLGAVQSTKQTQFPRIPMPVVRISPLRSAAFAPLLARSVAPLPQKWAVTTARVVTNTWKKPGTVTSGVPEVT